MARSPEPAVYVRGRRLSGPQAMTVRVAHEGRMLGRIADADIPSLVACLQVFEKTLAEEGLGDDHHGRTMVGLYTEHSRAVRVLAQES